MKRLFAALLRGDGMKEKNFQKYPKWLKDEEHREYVLRAIVILWIYVNENRLDIDKSKHEIETLYLYINEMKRDTHD